MMILHKYVPYRSKIILYRGCVSWLCLVTIDFSIRTMCCTQVQTNLLYLRSSYNKLYQSTMIILDTLAYVKQLHALSKGIGFSI